MENTSIATMYLDLSSEELQAALSRLVTRRETNDVAYLAICEGAFRAYAYRGEREILQTVLETGLGNSSLKTLATKAFKAVNIIAAKATNFDKKPFEYEKSSFPIRYAEKVVSFDERKILSRKEIQSRLESLDNWKGFILSNIVLNSKELKNPTLPHLHKVYNELFDYSLALATFPEERGRKEKELISKVEKSAQSLGITTKELSDSLNAFVGMISKAKAKAKAKAA